MTATDSLLGARQADLDKEPAFQRAIVALGDPHRYLLDRQMASADALSTVFTGDEERQATTIFHHGSPGGFRSHPTL